VDYLHKLEQQHGRYAFHVGEKGAFVLMLKEVVKDGGGLAVVTSQKVARAVKQLALPVPVSASTSRGNPGRYNRPARLHRND
jgi:hypothetical protein